MITKEINLKEKPIFWLGDRFYKVEKKLVSIHIQERTKSLILNALVVTIQEK